MHVTYLTEAMIILPPVNQIERITIFTLYLALESKMLKKQVFLARETLELCGYVISRL